MFGSSSRGRLELASSDGWLTDYTPGAVAWRPVCDSALFDESMVQVMCELLGFKHGRKYYTPKVSYRGLGLPPPPSSPTVNPLGYVYCSPTSASGSYHRRLQGGAAASQLYDTAGSSSSSSLAAATLGGVVADRHPLDEHRDLDLELDPAAVAAASGGPYGGAAGVRRHLQHQEQQRLGRSLHASLQGSVNTGSGAPYECTFRPGDCGYRGPLVGLECSDTPMPPGPPPPPVPPRPPAAPPPSPPPVRLIGGKYITDSRVEPNLCAGNNLCADYYGRVELLVAAPGRPGVQTWAPLCASPGLSKLIGYLVCRQVFAYLNLYPGESVSTVPQVPLGAGGFPIPTGSVYGAGDFDPRAHTAWASVLDGDYPVLDSTVIHDLSLQVSSSPCQAGVLFALSCTIRQT